jgi:tRNA (guanine37-N1)-methyltransferase
MMRIDVLTLFPEMFEPVLAASITGRAAQAGIASYHLHDIRSWSTDPHSKVDDRPFGGGPGMVMTCQPLFDAVHAVEAMDRAPARRVLLTPQGERLTQTRVEMLSREPRLLLISGHYEGVDERVVEELAPLEISVGDYVLSGGELPAMLLIDAVVRLQPGALGHEDSAAEDSFSERVVADEGRGAGPKGGGPATGGRPSGRHRLLDCPHYTRPREWRNRSVPPVLLSGDHAAVARWRTEQMIERTRARRPDLIEKVRDP